MWVHKRRSTTVLWITVAEKPLSLSVTLQSCFCPHHSFILGPNLFLAIYETSAVAAQLIIGCQHRLWPHWGGQQSANECVLQLHSALWKPSEKTSISLQGCVSRVAQDSRSLWKAELLKSRRHNTCWDVKRTRLLLKNRRLFQSRPTDEFIMLFFFVFFQIKVTVLSLTLPGGVTKKSLIKSRSHNKSCPPPLALKQSNVTLSFLSALCISSFTSAESSQSSGTRPPDNEEKMRGAEAMKGNIPSNMPLLLSSASLPSALSPFQPLNFYSQAIHQAGPSVESRKLDWEPAVSKPRELGMRCLSKRRWPLSQLWARVKLTAMFKRPGGNYRVSKPWVQGGTTWEPAPSGWE